MKETDITFQKQSVGLNLHNLNQITISRPTLTEESLLQESPRNINHDECRSFREKTLQSCNDAVSKITCRSLTNGLLKMLPIVTLLKDYKWRQDIMGDTVSGITTAVMRIPQEMAYAILATVPAVYGLYTAFFPVLVYAFLGTSRHISIGTWAVVSIMIGNAIDTVLDIESASNINGTSELDIGAGIGDSDDNDDALQRVQIATSLCLLVGIIQAIMGIFRLGFITTYLSEPLIRGFTTGAAIHVFTSQFPKLLGVKTTRRTGIFTVIYTYVEIFSKLGETNPCAVAMSLLALVMLIGFAEFNDWQAHKAWCRKEGKKGKKLPIPSELIVVICATLASYLGTFESTYKLPVVGHVPTGLPAPVIPPLHKSVSLLGSAFTMAVVSFAISISMAQLFAKKHDYEVDSNQELLAYGSCHIVGSFFRCFPHATSMSRSAVQEGSGGKTQIAGIISALVVLSILLRLGPLFSQLPQCILGAIIVVALRGILRQFKDLLLLWKVNFVDFMIWISTFLAVCLLGVDIGLLCGVGVGLMTVIIRTQIPNSSLVGFIHGTDVYRDVSRVSNNQCNIEVTDKSHPEVPSTPSTIIIDCTRFHFVDTVGVKTLQTVMADFDKLDIGVVFANCNESVRKSLLTSTTLNKKQSIGLDRMYVTLHDAVVASADKSAEHNEVQSHQHETCHESCV